MALYHTNPETGEPGTCQARTPERCKYFRPGGPPVPHHGTEAEARAAYEATQEAPGAPRSRAFIQELETTASRLLVGDTVLGTRMTDAGEREDNALVTRVDLGYDQNYRRVVDLEYDGATEVRFAGSSPVRVRRDILVAALGQFGDRERAERLRSKATWKRHEREMLSDYLDAVQGRDVRGILDPDSQAKLSGYHFAREALGRDELDIMVEMETLLAESNRAQEVRRRRRARG